MDSDIVIKSEKVGKKYCRDLKRSLAYGVADIISDLLARRGYSEKLRKDEFWANKEISFEIKKGESVGIIGSNGAGKTTLLKMLTGIIKPDSGRIKVSGNVGALVALGAGFNPILTGRENIFINGAVLGFSAKQIDERLDEIVEFAEIGEFINAPVRSYSSGMKVRLGFAIASHMDPDILLIDEVLAVGDQAFKNKCFRHLRSLLDAERTIVLVSHSMPQVQNVCERAILLDKGCIIEDGPVREVVASYYERNVSGKPGVQKVRIKQIPHIYLVGKAEFVGGCCLNNNGFDCTEKVQTGANITIRIKLRLSEEILNPHIQFFVHADAPGNSIACVAMKLKQSLGKGLWFIDFRMVLFPFAPGLYFVGSRIAEENIMEKLAYSDDIFSFRVVPQANGLKTNKPGYFWLHGHWNVLPLEADSDDEENEAN